MERRDNAAVAGAGDLIFEYVFALPGNSLNLKTGSFLQQGATAGLSTSPQRVPRGFMLGKAFFVYWPAGYRPLGLPYGIEPDFGDMRFIH